MKTTNRVARIATTLLCLAVLTSASFAKSNPLNIPRGLAVDAQGNLWVANAGTNSILAFNSGYKQLTSSTITESIVEPTGVAFDTLGNLWVSNYYTGNVGAITEYVNGVQNSSATITEGIDLPTALTVDGLNNIWVVNYNNGSGNPSITVYESASPDQPPAVLAQTLSVLPPALGITIAPGGTLAYGSNGFTYYQPVTPALINGTLVSSYYFPQFNAAALTSAGGLEYIATIDGSVYTAAGFVTNKLFQAPFTPYGIAVDTVRKRVYVSSGYSNSIAVYSSTTGALLHTID
jgi:hypothetical protein